MGYYLCMTPYHLVNFNHDVHELLGSMDVALEMKCVPLHEPADIIFIYPYGSEHDRMDLSTYRHRVCINFEAFHISQEDISDTVIGYTRFNSSRHLYMPNWPFWFQSACKLQHLAFSANERIRHHHEHERLFCNYIYSHTSASDWHGVPFDGIEFRRRFLQTLQKDSHDGVSCGGSDFNATPFRVPHGGGLYEYMSRHRWSISMENKTQKGYVTEKISNAFVSGTIPIYYGTKDVDFFFNPEAFLHARDFGFSVDALAKRVMEIDGNPNQYEEMLSKPIFKNRRSPESYISETMDFLSRRLNLTRVI